MTRETLNDEQLLQKGSTGIISVNSGGPAGARAACRASARPGGWRDRSQSGRGRESGEHAGAKDSGKESNDARGESCVKQVFGLPPTQLAPFLETECTRTTMRVRQ